MGYLSQYFWSMENIESHNFDFEEQGITVIYFKGNRQTGTHREGHFELTGVDYHYHPE